MESTPIPTLLPITPTPSIPRSIVEEIAGAPVLTYLIEDGSKPGDNFMSVIYTITADVITEEGRSKERRHYLFKCYPRHPARQAYLNKTNMFHNELSFYSIWVKALKEFQTDVLEIPLESVLTPAFPPYIGGKAIDFSKRSLEEDSSKIYQPIENFIVLTDLRRELGYKMLDRTVGLELDHINLTIIELAKIHALSWAYRQKVEDNLLKKFPFLEPAFDDEDKVMWGNIVGQNVEIAVNTMDEALGPGNHLTKSILTIGEKVLKVIELFLDQKEEDERKGWELHREPPPEMVKASEGEKLWRVILHGDTWCNNLLFKKGANDKPEAVMLVDFQLSRPGCPTADLVYLLYTSTTVEFRRQYLHKSLQLYYDKFNEFCGILGVDTLPDFSMEVLRRRFHRNKISGFMMAVTTFPMMLKDSSKASDLEVVCKDVKMDDMMSQAFGEGASDSDLYKKRILEIAQELYDEGVI